MPNDSCSFSQSFEPNMLKPKKLCQPIERNPRQFWIRYSNHWWDSRFLELYSRFQSQGFQIPQTKISQIPESGIPCMEQG